MASAPGAAVAGSPFPQWTVNTSGWVVAEVIDAAEKTLAEAAVYPDTIIFFTSKSAADNYVKSKGGKPVTTIAAKEGGQAALNAGSAAASGVFSLPASIGNFFAALGDGSTWLRIAKVVVGAALMIVGVAHMTGASKTITSAAKTVEKVAPVAAMAA